MARYTFYNKDTDEYFEMDMPWQELDAFLEKCPNLVQEFRINIGDPVSLGVLKPPIEFRKDVLGKVASMPGANKDKIYKRWGKPTEI